MFPLACSAENKTVGSGYVITYDTVLEQEVADESDALFIGMFVCKLWLYIMATGLTCGSKDPLLMWYTVYYVCPLRSDGKWLDGGAKVGVRLRRRIAAFTHYPPCGISWRAGAFSCFCPVAKFRHTHEIPSLQSTMREYTTEFSHNTNDRTD